jgi:hypothetical protein
MNALAKLAHLVGVNFLAHNEKTAPVAPWKPDTL